MPRPSSPDINTGAPLSPFSAPPLPAQALPASAPFSYAGQPVPPVPAAGATPTPAGLLNAFKRRWVLGTVLGMVAACGVAVAAWMFVPGGKHEARGLIDLPEPKPDLSNKGQPDYENYRKNQVYILKTHDLLNRTINDPAVSSLEMIRNQEDPVRMLEENITVAAPAYSIVSVTLKGSNVEEMKTIVDALMKRFVDDSIATDRRDRLDQVKKYEKLEQELGSEIESQERTIKMIARGTGASGGEMAAAEQLTNRKVELNRLITTINDDITKLESQLKIVENQLGWFTLTDKALDTLRSNNVPDTVLYKLMPLKNKEFRSRRSFVDELNKLFPKDELDHSLRSNILNVAQVPETQRPVIPEADIEAEINKDARIVRLQKELDDFEGLLQREKNNAVDPKASPVVIAGQERVDQKQREIVAAKSEIRGRIISVIKSRALQAMQNKVNDLEVSIAIHKEARDRYKESYDSINKSQSNWAEGNVAILQMAKGLEAQRDTLGKVRMRLAELRVETHMDNRARIREAAAALPSTNNKKTLVASVLGLGTFCFVVLLVAFLEWRTRRVDGVDQVVSELGMRIIGTVPTFPNRANVKAAVEAGGANWRFALNESINSTRTMLLHAARNQSMQVVMVTSATQGEGKTSVTSQLATSMATAGMRTLIVDCDLRNPSIHKLFDLGLAPGVSETLTQDVDPSDAIHPTTVPNLWVIPAGQCSNRVIAALAQGHPLETLFNRLRGQFDFVIVDSCPVLPVADALLIGQHVDGVLFSIMQDISQIPKVVLASEKLSQLNIPLLGAVVNGIKQDVYSYGYNYVKQLPA